MTDLNGITLNAEFNYDTEFWLLVGAITLLICLSAVFSGSETAFTSASRGKLRAQADRGNRAAARALRITGNLEKLIGAVLLGNNLVNILATALATSLFTQLFGDSGVALATLAMTLLILFFAELLPKTYSITRPETASRRISPVIAVVVFLFHPIVAILRFLAVMLLRVFGVQPSEVSPVKDAQEEIAGTIALVHSAGAIQTEYRNRVLGALDLGNLTVREVMRHRSEIEMISADSTLKSAISLCARSPHTRLPVHQPGSEEIVGVIHAKDLLTRIPAILESPDPEPELLELAEESGAMKEPYFVPETTTLDDQLRQFLKRRSHFALVVDEYGALQGLITLEDVLEEIVGEITDEHDEHPDGRPLQRIDGSFIVNGALPIRDLNRELDWQLPEENATTVAGLLIYEARVIPEVGREFNYHGFRFKVLERKARRITRIQLTRL
ncbi:MAG: HlyC/CorC family transporter [Rhodobacteraceae bacterium]|nr:HlyC/CorC family transporter [Paracoccaceae bacterium]